MKKTTTADGYTKLLALENAKKKYALSDKLTDKLSIVAYFDDLWTNNQNLPPDDQLSRREIIQEAYKVFRVDYSTLYRIWAEATDKLGLAAVIPKNALTQYIISKSMYFIDKEESNLETDTRAVAMLLKNLTTIEQNMPVEEEEREALPIPIFVFNDELLANHVNNKKIDIAKVLVELRSKEQKEPIVKGGEYIQFEEQ